MAQQTVEPEHSAGIGRNEPLRVVVTTAMIGLWVADLVVHHTHAQKVLGFVLIAVLARVTVTDLEQRRIRNGLMFVASVVAVLIGLVVHPGGLPAQLLWGIGTGTFMFVMAVIARGGLGMGDVKLGAVLGLFLSRYVVYALAIGLLASALFGTAVLARRGLAVGRKTKIPLGPFLAFGGVIAVLAGPWLLSST
jgi:leader peptidase (prepilin peptidase) / N-methyltransferase